MNKQPTRIEIESAIKNASYKWLKNDYIYSINSMLPYYWGDGTCYTKNEVIQYFYTLCETKFFVISNFTTFKNFKS